MDRSGCTGDIFMPRYHVWPLHGILPLCAWIIGPASGNALGGTTELQIKPASIIK